jgi:hypothetical protein
LLAVLGLLMAVVLLLALTVQPLGGSVMLVEAVEAVEVVRQLLYLAYDQQA